MQFIYLIKTQLNYNIFLHKHNRNVDQNQGFGCEQYTVL